MFTWVIYPDIIFDQFCEYVTMYIDIRYIVCIQSSSRMLVVGFPQFQPYQPVWNCPTRMECRNASILYIYICFPEKIEKWWRDMKSNASRFYWDATFLSLFHHLLGLLMCSIYIHRSTRTECTRTSHAWNTWRLSWQDDNLSSWMGLGKIYRLSPWLSPWEAFAVPWKSTVNGCQSTNPCWDVFFQKKKGYPYL